MTNQYGFKPTMVDLLDIVFALESDSPLHHALYHRRYNHPKDLCMMSLNEIKSLTYTGDNGDLLTISSAYVDLLKAFKEFVIYQNTNGWLIIFENWLELTYEHSHDFASKHTTIVFSIPSLSNPSLPPTNFKHETTVCTSSVAGLVDDHTNIFDERWHNLCHLWGAMITMKGALIMQLSVMTSFVF